MFEKTQDKQSLSVTREGLIPSSHYAEVMERTVRPYLKSHRADETVSSGGCGIFTSRFEAEGEKRGTVMIVHGFTENVEKYTEIIYSLLRNGWCVLAYDQRGHGRSWREKGLADLSLTHVDHFEEYVKDMEIVVSRLLVSMPGPRMLFCHSMGGAVSALFLEKNAAVFQKAVFSSPMIAPNIGGFPRALVKAVCRVPIALGRGNHRAFISHPFSGPEDFETSCASGKERCSWYDSLRCATPEFQNNGPSYGWSLESMNVTNKILASGMPEKITIPVRVYSAEKDTSVLFKPQESFVHRLPRGVLRTVPGSKHEIYRSPDSVLFPWWHDVLSFFASPDGKEDSP